MMLHLVGEQCMNFPETRDTSIKEVSVVLARAARFSMWLGVRTLKAAEVSKRVDIGNAPNLFLPIHLPLL